MIVIIEMESPTDLISDLIKIDFIRMKNGVPLRDGITDDALEKLKNLEVGNDNVMVAGYAKTGNHYCKYFKSLGINECMAKLLDKDSYIYCH